MQIEVAVNKTAKYAVGDSGDSSEVVERPKGGVTALLVDGQGSGRSAKIISNLVVSKAMSLVADGTRDGAVARAAHDYLFALRDGKVSATLTMLSADLNSRTIVISRNSNCPVLVKQGERVHVLADPVNPIGFHPLVKPVIHEIPLEEDTMLLAFTDGIMHAGRKYGRQLEMDALITMLYEATASQTQQLANRVFSRALELDEARASDDMTLLAMGVHRQNEERVARLHLTYPA